MAHEERLEAGLVEIFRRPVTDAEFASFDAVYGETTGTLEQRLNATFRVAADSDQAESARTAISFYQVFYGRQPDEAGLDFWTEAVESGTSLNDLGEFFASASEFNERFGDQTPTEQVFAQYRNVLGREPDFEGLTFWTNLVNDGQISLADLGRFFATSPEFQERADASIDAFLINAANGEQDFGEESLFDEVLGNGTFEVNGVQETAVRTALALNTQAGATSVSGGAEGGPGLTALRLTGDADARIDLTDPRSQLEQLDLDGDGIRPGELDFNVRDAIPVSGFEIIDAHARGDALLDPTNSVSGYSGNLAIDGTGFDGDGNATDGNIILSGYGADLLFGGIGNDFFSTGGNFTTGRLRDDEDLRDFFFDFDDGFRDDDIRDDVDAGPFVGDEVKGGRNADFIYYELSALEGGFAGRPSDDLDGGTTFDDDASQDNDWLLLEASDDEEPVQVILDESGVEGTDAARGTLSTRLRNDSADIYDIENLNGSGNFYKFLNIASDGTSFSDIDAFRIGATSDSQGSDAAYARITSVVIPINGITLELTEAQLADVSNFDEFLALAQEDFQQTDGITVSRSTFQGQPIILVEDANFRDRDFNEAAVRVRGDFFNTDIQAVQTARPFNESTEGNPLFGDVFFGDNRDFSPEEVEHRVPGLSPGVTAQMRIDGSEVSNTIIAGYDNDIIRGNNGNDLLFGGDLEFLLTHRHNANLFDPDGTISVNADGDGVADDGRDELYGGNGDDSLVYEADGGVYDGGSNNDTLWLTPFSTGRLDSVSRSTDGSESRFLGIDGAGTRAVQDLQGAAEASAERAAAAAVTTDGILRFDLAEYRGYGGADRAGTADQTNYAAGFGPTDIANIENIDASGLGGIDYMAAGTNGVIDAEGNRLDGGLNFENQQNYRAANTDLQLLGGEGMNILRGGNGDDEIEGRENMDILTGGRGNDTFFETLNNGNNIQGFGLTTNGDGVDFIERVIDADGDGIADFDAGGDLIVGQDFRARVGDGATTSRFQIDPVGLFDRVGEDEWGNFTGVELVINGQIQVITIGQPVDTRTAAQVRNLLENALNAANVEFVSVSNDQDSVFIDFVESAGVTAVNAEFLPPSADFGGYQSSVSTGQLPEQFEDDKLVFRAYQDRADGESVPDLQASLGIDAYANDLVVGFTNEGTVLAEEQEFCIKLVNLKDRDVVSVKVNGQVYTRTVGFNEVTGENITGETTEAFTARLIDWINSRIALNPNSRDGDLIASFGRENFDAGKVSQIPDDNSNPGNTATFYLRQGESMDGEEHVFMNTPTVTVNNRSGGEGISFEVIDISQTSVLLRDYDGRSINNDSDDPEGAQGLNSGFIAEDDRDDGRFITFEDLSGENRAVLQTAEGEGADGGNRESGLEGGEILTFNNQGRDEDLTPLAGDTISEKVNADGQFANGTNPGNDFDGNPFQGEIGQPFAVDENGNAFRDNLGRTFSALHGDDLLIGSQDGESIDGQTGDDRIIGSRSENLSTRADFVWGGQNVVIDLGGVIQKNQDGSLVQDANAAQGTFRFIDTLIFEQGSMIADPGSDGLTSGGSQFSSNAVFRTAVNGFSADGGMIGTVRVDENNDLDFADVGIDSLTNFREIELLRVLSDRGSEIDFSGLGSDGGIDFSNGADRNGDGDDDDDGEMEGGLTFTDADGDVFFGMIKGGDSFTLTGGDDVFFGGVRNETINGGGGDDEINGGIGSDTINGGSGANTLTGGAGADTFVFTDDSEDGNVITDFNQANDLIDLRSLNIELTDITITATGFEVDFDDEGGAEEVAVTVVGGGPLVNDDFLV